MYTIQYVINQISAVSFLRKSLSGFVVSAKFLANLPTWFAMHSSRRRSDTFCGLAKFIITLIFSESTRIPSFVMICPIEFILLTENTHFSFSVTPAASILCDTIFSRWSYSYWFLPLRRTSSMSQMTLGIPDKMCVISRWKILFQKANVCNNISQMVW